VSQDTGRVRTSYETIGRRYSATRHADPKIARLLNSAIGDAASVVNVGAGTGSYEPADRRLVAVEPSSMMLRQRPRGSAPAVQATAEALPFSDRSFDAAMAILTLHHWDDPPAGLRELRRVASRVVVLTLDIEALDSFWLLTDYFPAIAKLERARTMAIRDVLAVLGTGTIVPVPIPHDCLDGFTRAFWRRPRAYLDPNVRAGMSTFAAISETDTKEGLQRLAGDLDSGEWSRRFSYLMRQRELDLGYRLIVS
jgi:SAM-dependent methyltransferase